MISNRDQYHTKLTTTTTDLHISIKKCQHSVACILQFHCDLYLQAQNKCIHSRNTIVGVCAVGYYPGTVLHHSRRERQAQNQHHRSDLLSRSPVDSLRTWRGGEGTRRGKLGIQHLEETNAQCIQHIRTFSLFKDHRHSLPGFSI